MEEYIVVEFDSRRLQRGEKHCFRTNVFIGGEPDGWVWLSMDEIKEIMKDCACRISGHEEFVKNGS